ncbi:MAG: hypothetical protein V4649_01200 [Bacteroidota bacterium]
MNIFDRIIAFFQSSPGSSPARPSPPDSASSFPTLVEKIRILKEKSGEDLTALMYQPDFDKKLRAEILPWLNYNGCLDNDHWVYKHAFNFPGPFYTGESDTCGTGDGEAPQNVLYDAHYCEYIFKQPSNFEELAGVINAASVEVLDSYSSNGNEHWTYDLCKEWWSNRRAWLAMLNDVELKKVNRGREQLYIHYLQTDAEQDLRRYCFFLEKGYYPAEGEALPEL